MPRPLAKLTPTRSRKLGRPADTDSTDTRERIIQCARERFAAEGFEGTTNRDIADLAHVSSAALYHYFPSKADIYIAVCESIAESFTSVFDEAKNSGPTLEVRLTSLFGEVAVLGNTDPSVVGFITGISAVVRKHPEVSRGAETFGQQFRKHIVELIDTSTEKDLILQGATTGAFADLTSSILAGLGRMSARGDQKRHEAAADSFLRLIRGAVRN